MRESGGGLACDDEPDQEHEGNAHGGDARELDREPTPRAEARLVLHRLTPPLGEDDGQDHEAHDDEKGHGDELVIDVHGATFRFGSGFPRKLALAIRSSKGTSSNQWSI